MTPNPTSEPELETKPGATTDAPETSTDETTAVTTDKSTDETTAVTTDKTTAVATDEPTPSADEPTAETVVDKPAVDKPAVDEPAAETVVDEPKPDATEAPDSEAPVYAAAPVSEFVAPTDMVASGSKASSKASETDPYAGLDESAVPATPAGQYPTLVPLVSALLGLTLLFSLLIVAFALPAVHSGPSKLPVGVSGPTAVTGQLKKLFDTPTHEFDVTVYPTDAALRKAIKNHEEYGGFSVSDTTATMLVSSAAGFDAALELSSFASSISSQSQTQIPVNDVVPLPKKDPRGHAISALGLPLALGSLLPAIVMFLLYRRRAISQVAGVLGASVLIGLAVAAILDFWLGSTKGSNYFTVTLAIALGVAAVSLLMLGLAAVAGRIGLAIGAAVIVLISAPLSGLESGQYWLSGPWGTIGQLLPIGAAGTALRSVAYFHWHGAGAGLLVLAGWALIGVILFVLGTLLITDPAEDAVIKEGDLAQVS
jgi:hypothetical protein